MIKVNIENLEEGLKFITQEVAEILNFEFCLEGTKIKSQNIKKGLRVLGNSQEAVIEYNSLNEFMRGLGVLAENLTTNQNFDITQTKSYNNLSAMLDCSRNAVMTVDAVKKMIRHLSLMGYNQIQLYTEDTFEVKEYPYFGYFRGRYNSDEIKEIDNYAIKFGVEMVPCIQTLAHFNSTVKWNYFRPIHDTGDILLVGEPKTYEFIESMVKSCSEMYSSKKINIGMDEAFSLGLGEYKNRNKDKEFNRFQVMMDHLTKVRDICKKYGFEPMMWSDMFFSLLGEGDSFDEKTGKIKQEVIDKVPKDVELVYWDYFKDTKEKYDERMKKHKMFDNIISFAGGAWRWRGFMPGNQFTFWTSEMALDAVKDNNVKNVIVTAWGDNGAECSMFSILPSFQFFAEKCFCDTYDKKHLAKRFKICANGDFDGFMELDTPNFVLGSKAPGIVCIYPSKQFLYQDILQGLVDKHIKDSGENLKEYYNSCVLNLKKAKQNNPYWEYIFNTAISFCELLSVKTEIGVNLKTAYDNNDKKSLEKYANETIPNLIKLTENFYEIYRAQWLCENKIFGFDVIDLRFGGILMRSKHAIIRIKDYLNETISKIDELEQERLNFDMVVSGYAPNNLSEECNWINVATASVI